MSRASLACGKTDEVYRTGGSSCKTEPIATHAGRDIDALQPDSPANREAPRAYEALEASCGRCGRESFAILNDFPNGRWPSRPASCEESQARVRIIAMCR